MTWFVGAIVAIVSTREALASLDAVGVGVGGVCGGEDGDDEDAGVGSDGFPEEDASADVGVFGGEGHDAGEIVGFLGYPAVFFAEFVLMMTELVPDIGFGLVEMDMG